MNKLNPQLNPWKQKKKNIKKYIMKWPKKNLLNLNLITTKKEW